MLRVKSKSAFTLIELLVVVLIIAILSAVAVSKYMRAVEKAQIAEANVVLKSMADAANHYYTFAGSYKNGETHITVDDLAVTPPSNGKFAYGISLLRHNNDYQMAVYAQRINENGSRVTGKRAFTLLHALDSGKLLEKRCYTNTATVMTDCPELGFICSGTGNNLTSTPGYNGFYTYCIFK